MLLIKGQPQSLRRKEETASAEAVEQAQRGQADRSHFPGEQKSIGRTEGEPHPPLTDPPIDSCMLGVDEAARIPWVVLAIAHSNFSKEEEFFQVGKAMLEVSSEDVKCPEGTGAAWMSVKGLSRLADFPFNKIGSPGHFTFRNDT